MLLLEIKKRKNYQKSSNLNSVAVNLWILNSSKSKKKRIIKFMDWSEIWPWKPKKKSRKKKQFGKKPTRKCWPTLKKHAIKWLKLDKSSTLSYNLYLKIKNHQCLFLKDLTFAINSPILILVFWLGSIILKIVSFS